MKKMLVGILLATVAMFLWGMIFWMNPGPMTVLKKTNGDMDAGRALLEHFPESGTYILPGSYNDGDIFNKLYRLGPIVTLHIQRRGADPQSVGLFFKGFLHMFIVAGLIGLMMKVTVENYEKYWSRVGPVLLFAVAAAIWGNLKNPIWWRHPWDWHLLNSLYDVTTIFVAGLVLASFIKPEEKEEN